MGCRDVVVEVALLFRSQPHPLDGLLELVLTACPTLTYGSKKLPVHGNGHTPVNCVGSQAKLGEGNMWCATPCEGVCLTPSFIVHEVNNK